MGESDDVGGARGDRGDRGDGEWEVLPDGSIHGPDGAVYRRNPERVKKRNGEAHVAAGVAVVTDVYPEGLMWWPSGENAESAWSQIAPRLVVGKKPTALDLQWVGHV